MLIKTILILLAFGLSLSAQNLKIASGAGYKKPLMDIIKEYEKTGKTVEPFFGNMRQISTQSKHTNIALMIGDKNFLSKKSGLNFKNYINLGKGKVVLAFSKNSSLKQIDDLKNKNITKVAMPQPKKAIYGIAGKEFLKNSNLYQRIKEKLYIVATIPQVITYVITNEVEAGIVNLTAVLANKNKLGGYIEVDQKYYTPIDIVAGKLNHCNTKECEEFSNFLQSKTAKDIFKKYGM